MNKSDWIAQHRDFPWLSPDDTACVDRLLRRLRWLDDGEQVRRCPRAGEGNMNLTLRVVTDRRTLILKQARPWVEKYDAIAAPWDRVVSEARFYQAVADLETVCSRMPRLLGFDAQARVILLEDLGEASDYTGVYGGAEISDGDLAELASFLRELHDATQGQVDGELANRDMRALNHEHIYRFPLLADNGLDLERFEPGLNDAAATLKRDDEYVERATDLGRLYLADGQHLLHGDYFPGSWLRTGGGPRVIDPEFCFPGPREFDVACALAHLALAAQEQAARKFVSHYGDWDLDAALLARFAAAEVMRRIIGVAQLPIAPSNGRRTELLQRSRQAMLTDDWSCLCS